MSHSLSARPHAHTDVRVNATPNSDLISAFCQMTAGIKKPKRIAWKMYDAKRGRPINPLGTFPEVAEECIDAGASFYNVAKPLMVMLAHLRRRLGNGQPSDIREALTNAKRERAEAECAELSLALSVQGPEHSTLAAYVKEEREALVAEERAVEVAEQMLYAESK